MKVVISKKDLINLSINSQNIAEKKQTMQILINILLKAHGNVLEVKATDLEVSFKNQVPARVEEEGEIAVHAKNFFEIVRELGDEGDIVLEQKDNYRLQISQKKAVFNIVGVDPNQYPVFPTYEAKNFMEVDSGILGGMIDRTIYSVSNDDTRYHLNGAYFEKKSQEGKIKFKMVATDGHRLSVVERFMEKEESSQEDSSSGIIIPRKGLLEIKKIIESSVEPICMAVEGPQLVIQCGARVLMIRLIQGDYPDYQQLIPSESKKSVSMGRESLLSCVRRVSLLTDQKSRGLVISLEQGQISIASSNPEMGEAREEIDVDYQGEDLKISFNARYILDILNSFQEDKLRLSLDSQLAPGLISPEKDRNYTCVIMPMRI